MLFPVIDIPQTNMTSAANSTLNFQNLGVLTRHQLLNLLHAEDFHEQMAHDAYMDAHFPPLPSSRT